MATVRKRGKSYQIRASAGYDISGKQIVKTMSWTPPENLTAKQIEKEQNRVMVEFERLVSLGQCVNSNIRFAEYAELWMKKGKEGGERPLAPKTFDRYKSLLVRINAAIGNIRLSELQPQHIKAFLDNLREAGIRDDVKYLPLIDLGALLKERGLSRQTLAEKAGIAASTINVACRGSNVKKNTAEAICKVLNLKLKDVFKANSTDGKLSDKTILHHYSLISTILNSAVVDDQALLSNPAKRVRPPHCKHLEAQYLDEVQAAHLIDLLESKPMLYKTMIILFLYSGMRRGELCGLEWKDVDFNNNIVSICRVSQYTPEKGIFTKSTKTVSSVRTIKLPAIALEYLRKYKLWQSEQRLSVGDQWEDCDRIYTSWNGKPAHPDTLTAWFKDFVKQTDLPDIHIHSLRHTNATLLIAGGEDIKTVSRRLGHAQVTTTVNTYTHAIESADAKAADTLENILTPFGKKA